MHYEDPELFSSNLAELLPDTILGKLAEQLLEAINMDDDSRKKWLKTDEIINNYIGFSVEDTSLKQPFQNAAGVFDTTLSSAIINFCCIAKAELFPSKGPCYVEVLGNQEEDMVSRANRIQHFLNYYLTEIDQDYIRDATRALMNVGRSGCCFRKVYIDPTTNLPVIRTVLARDFIVNNDSLSLLQSSRLTHIIYYSAKEIILNQLNGKFKDIPLSSVDEGSDVANQSRSFYKDNKSEGIEINEDERINKIYKCYECHVDLTDSQLYGDFFDVPEGVSREPTPYVITLLSDKKILSIRRNFKMGDPLKKRNKVFTRMEYIPSFGVYSFGLGHILGPNTVIITKLLRSILNAESMKIFPPRFKKKGVEIDRTSVNIGPSEIITVDLKNETMDSAFPTPQLTPPSEFLTSLLRDIREQTQNLAGVCNIRIPEGGVNAPVGTTLALLESNNRDVNSVLQGLHASLSEELQILYEYFSGNIDGNFNFDIKGMSVVVSPDDFASGFKIKPTADPQVSTIAHGLIKAEAIYKMAQANPELHNMREVYLMMYKNMGIEDVEKILPPPTPPLPPPIDPNAVLEKDVNSKIQNNEANHKIDMLRLQLESEKKRADYIIDSGKLCLEYLKAGLQPPGELLDTFVPKMDPEKLLQEQEMEEKMEQQNLDAAEVQGNMNQAGQPPSPQMMPQQ